MIDLQFYYIDKKYIEYIRRIDKRVATKKRPYLGIVLKNKEYIYLAPLYSAKEKHKSYYMNNTFFRIYDYNNNYMGLIRFSNMIPVPRCFIHKVDYKYSNRLYQEYCFIFKYKNQILKRAKITYLNYEKYKDLCVNFKKIENVINKN